MPEAKLSQADKAYIIAKIFSDNYNVIYFNKHFYLFHEGIWRLESDENTESWIVKEYIKEHSTPPKKASIAEVVEYIKSLTYDKYRKKIKYYNENHISNTINTQSGILDLTSLKVKPYEKEDFCFYKLPFDYVEKPECEVLKGFLTSSMDYDFDKMTAEDIEEYKKVMYFIQEWMGYSLVAGNKLEKCLLMIGEGANGKSVLQDIWEYIIGQFNCSYVDVKYINDGSQIFMTRNKLINFTQDLESNQQLDSGTMKKAVSGQIVTANEKYKGQVDMYFTAKIIIACNELPYIKNASTAVKRRFHILPFTRVFEEHEQDKDLTKKLKEEASHIFSWAVNGLKNLKKRGHFVVPERCKYSMSNYIKNNDSIALWMEEDDIKDEGGKAKTNDVFKSYQNYCEQSGLKSFGRNKFYERMGVKGYNKFISNGTWYFQDMKVPNQTIL